VKQRVIIVTVVVRSILDYHYAATYLLIAITEKTKMLQRQGSKIKSMANVSANNVIIKANSKTGISFFAACVD